MPCRHPPDQLYAWIVPPPAMPPGVRQPPADDVLCLGCLACGAILSGDAEGEGPLLSPTGKPRRQKKGGPG